MNKKTAVKLSLLAPLLCAALALSASAQAQSGHRICGQWGVLPNNGGYVGILVDVENGGSSKANAACDEVKSASTSKVLSRMNWNRLEGDPASIKWTVQGTTACENVGKYFVSKREPNVDMCQYMNGYIPYFIQTVQQNPGASTFSSTSYRQLTSEDM